MGNEKDHGVLLDGSSKIVLGGLIAEFSGYTASSVCDILRGRYLFYL